MRETTSKTALENKKLKEQRPKKESNPTKELNSESTKRIKKFVVYSSGLNFVLGFANLLFIILIKSNLSLILDYRYFTSIFSVCFSVFTILFEVISKFITREMDNETIITQEKNLNNEKILKIKNDFACETDKEKKLDSERMNQLENLSNRTQIRFLNNNLTNKSKKNKVNKNIKNHINKRTWYYLVFMFFHILLQSQNFYLMNKNILDESAINFLNSEFHFKSILAFFFFDMILKFIFVNFFLSELKINFLANLINLLIIILFEYANKQLKTFFASSIFYFLMNVFLCFYILEIQKNRISKIPKSDCEALILKNENNKAKAETNLKENSKCFLLNKNKNLKNENELIDSLLKINIDKKNNTLDCYYSKNNKSNEEFNDLSAQHKTLKIERFRSCENFRKYNSAANFGDIVNFKINRKDSVIFSKFKNPNANDDLNINQKENLNMMKINDASNNDFNNYNYFKKNNDNNNNNNNNNRISLNDFQSACCNYNNFNNSLDNDFLKNTKLGFICFSMPENKIKRISNFFQEEIQYFKSFEGIEKIIIKNNQNDSENSQKKKKLKMISEHNKSGHSTRAETFRTKIPFDKKLLNIKDSCGANKTNNDLMFVKQIITCLDIYNSEINLFGETRNKFFEILKGNEVEFSNGNEKISNAQSAGLKVITNKKQSNYKRNLFIKINSEKEDADEKEKEEEKVDQKLIEEKNFNFKNNFEFDEKSENFDCNNYLEGECYKSDFGCRTKGSKESKDYFKPLRNESDVSIKKVKNDEINLEVFGNDLKIEFDEENMIFNKNEDKNSIKIVKDLLQRKYSSEADTKKESSINFIASKKTNKLKNQNDRSEEKDKEKDNLNSEIYSKNIKIKNINKNNDSIDDIINANGNCKNKSQRINDSKKSISISCNKIDETIDDYKENFMVSPKEKYLNRFLFEQENLNKPFVNGDKTNKENVSANNLNLKFKRFERKSKATIAETNTNTIIVNKNDLILNNTNSINKNNSNQINRSNSKSANKQKDNNLINFLLENMDSFKNFTYIGKKVFHIESNQETEKNKFQSYNNYNNTNKNPNNNMLQNFLAVEIFLRITIQKTAEGLNNPHLEIMLNDITKKDLFFGVQQYIISSCQFLHDFKNPLFCINQEISESKANLELILKKDHQILIDKKAKADLISKYKFIKEVSEFCQGMILSYENYSKLLYKPKNFNLDLKTFSLKKFTKFFKNFMQIRLKKSNKNVQFYLHNLIKSSYYLKTDENKLKQILINLLSNSEKFTLRGKIELKITEEFLNKKNYVKFSVEDSGIGMDLKEQKQLFTPFNTQDKENLNPNGMGLGLVIVKEISTKLGLPIQLESKQGVGTKCWFLVENLKACNNKALRSESKERIVNLHKDVCDNINDKKKYKCNKNEKKMKKNLKIDNIDLKENLNVNSDLIKDCGNPMCRSFLRRDSAAQIQCLRNKLILESSDININKSCGEAADEEFKRSVAMRDIKQQTNQKHRSSIDDFIFNGSSKEKNLLQIMNSSKSKKTNNTHNKNLIIDQSPFSTQNQNSNKSLEDDCESSSENRLSLSSVSYDSQMSISTKSLKSLGLNEAMKMDSLLFRKIRQNLAQPQSEFSLMENLENFYVDFNFIPEENNDSIFFTGCGIIKNRNSCNFNEFVNPIKDQIDLIGFKKFLKKTEPRKKVINMISHLNDENNEHFEFWHNEVNYLEEQITQNNLKRLSNNFIINNNVNEFDEFCKDNENVNNFNYNCNNDNNNMEMNSKRNSRQNFALYKNIIYENNLFYINSNSNCGNGVKNYLNINNNNNNIINNNNFDSYDKNNQGTCIKNNSNLNGLLSGNINRNSLNNNQISKEISINLPNKNQNLFRSIELNGKTDSKKNIKISGKGSSNVNKVSMLNKREEKDIVNNLNRESMISAMGKAKKLRKLEEENLRNNHINHPYCNLSVNFIKSLDEKNLNEFYHTKNHLKQIISSSSDVNKIQDDNKVNSKFVTEKNDKTNLKFINYSMTNEHFNLIENQSEHLVTYKNSKENNEICKNSKTKTNLKENLLKNQNSEINQDLINKGNHSFSEINNIKYLTQNKSENKPGAFNNPDTNKNNNDINNNNYNNKENNKNNDKSTPTNKQSLQRKFTVINQGKNINEMLFRRNLTIKAKNLDTLLKRKEKIYNILIVDDSDPIRSSCKFILLKLEKIRNCKMIIDEANDGFAGLNHIFNSLTKEKKYDLIVLDDEMTYLNGTDMIKMIDMIIDKKFGDKIGLKKDLFEKVIVCSANPENLVHKIHVKNVKIFPKPLSLNFLQSYFDNLGRILFEDF